MKENKRILKRRERGITLIALVINIIVLLILAGVSISMLTGNNGIITQAQNAREETKIANVIEQAKTDILGIQAGNDGEIDKDQFVKILGNYFVEVPKSSELPDDLTTLTLTTKEEYGNYPINISEIYNGTFKEITYKKVADLKVGDRVYYKDKNNNDIECLVLYASSSKYGIQIVPKVGNGIYNISLNDEYFDGGKEFYNNLLRLLYDKCQEFLNTDYATSARNLGSNPENPTWDVFTNDAGYYTKEIATEKGEYQSWMEENNMYNNILKNEDEQYITDLEQIEKANIQLKGVWIMSSRYIEFLDSGDVTYTTFGVYKLLANGISKQEICQMYYTDKEGFNKYSYTVQGMVCPVFTIKNDLKITEGDGVNEPYRLVP